MRYRVLSIWAFGVLLSQFPGTAWADTEALAEQSQNPIANLTSLPFQNNTNFNVGRFGNDQNILNIQPVIPFELNEDWNLITRSILPLVYQPALNEGDSSDFGIGDFNPSLFFATTLAPGVTFGFGPAFVLPTATDARLGSEKWSAGPTAVAVVTQGPWVYGALASNVWSFAGESDRADINQFLLQYFINYNIGETGWYLVSAPIMTADWMRDDGDQWVLPIGGGVGRVFNVGAQPVNMSLQAYDNVITTEGGADWQLRFQVQLLFPQ